MMLYNPFECDACARYVYLPVLGGCMQALVYSVPGQYQAGAVLVRHEAHET